MSHVFLSYSTRDRSYAGKLAEKLRAEGFDVWIDNSRLRSSEDWWRSIVFAIDTCAAFVVLLTQESDQSKWVQREITLADQRNKPIFPLWLAGDIQTPNWAIFVRTQYEDVRDGKLPGPAFYEQLARHAPRRTGGGSDITDPRLSRPGPSTDPILIAALQDPPVEKKPQRHLLVRLLILLFLIGGAGFAILWLVDEGISLPGFGSRAATSANQYFLSGIRAEQTGDYRTAVAEFTQALDAGYQPQAEVLTLRGNMWRLLEEPNRALENYEQALNSDPAFAAAYFGRGQLFADQGEDRRAINDFTAALEHTSGDMRIDIHSHLGWSYLHLRENQQALEHFSAVIESQRDPERTVEAHFGMGSAFLEMGDFPQAVREFEQVIAINPDFSPAYRGLAQAFEAEGNLEAALSFYRQYLERSGDEAEEWVRGRIHELEQTASP